MKDINFNEDNEKNNEKSELNNDFEDEESEDMKDINFNEDIEKMNEKSFENFKENNNLNENIKNNLKDIIKKFSKLNENFFKFEKNPLNPKIIIIKEIEIYFIHSNLINLIDVFKNKEILKENFSKNKKYYKIKDDEINDNQNKIENQNKLNLKKEEKKKIEKNKELSLQNFFLIYKNFNINDIFLNILNEIGPLYTYNFGFF
jgi:hypothetical protein